MVAFGSCPKILGCGGELQMVLCHSMNAVSVVGKRFISFFDSKIVGTQNFRYKCSHRSHLVEFPLPNFLLVFH